MTTAAFRKLALSMPDAEEGEHHAHPDFRANGRIFASLHPDGERGMLRLPADEQQRLLRAHAAAFEPASGAWGRQGCTMVRLAAVDAALLRPSMQLAWQLTLQRPQRLRAGGAKPRASGAKPRTGGRKRAR